jgi:hypothetical protein
MRNVCQLRYPTYNPWDRLARTSQTVLSSLTLTRSFHHIAIVGTVRTRLCRADGRAKLTSRGKHALSSTNPSVSCCEEFF